MIEKIVLYVDVNSRHNLPLVAQDDQRKVWQKKEDLWTCLSTGETRTKDQVEVMVVSKN